MSDASKHPQAFTLPVRDHGDHSRSSYEFELDVPSAPDTGDYPRFKNLVIGFNDAGSRGIPLTAFFIEKLELKPLADVYIHKPNLFKAVGIIDGEIHSLLRLYGHGDILIAKLDIPYDAKLWDDIFTEIILQIYSEFHCECLIFLNSEPQNIEDYIPDSMKEAFLTKNLAPFQIEQMAYQQMQREPGPDDRKFVYFTNSAALKARIESAFADRVTFLSNGLIGNMIGLILQRSRSVAELNVALMTTKFNPVRIDPDPVINMVDFILAMSDAPFELDTSALREESDTYLRELSGKMASKLDSHRHTASEMMYA